MVRLLCLITLIRVLGFIFLLHHETIQHDANVVIQITNAHQNHYVASLLSIEDKPNILPCQITFYSKNPFIVNARYDVRVGLKVASKYNKKNWYQSIQSKTHQSVVLLSKPIYLGMTKMSYRDHVVRYFDKIIPSHPLKPIIISLLWGDRSELQSTLYDSFINTGTAHILAISGLHVSWVIGSIIAFGGSTYLALGVGWLYVLFTLAPPSAMRAIMMATLILCYPEWGWIYLILSTLCLHLLLSPMDSVSISTILSYWAIVMIRFISVFGKDRFFEFSLFLSLLMMPISLYFFHQWPIASMWLNIIVVPWFSFVVFPLIVLSLCASLIGFYYPWSVVYTSLSWMIDLLKVFETWPKIYLFQHVFFSAVIIQIVLFFYIIKRPKWPILFAFIGLIYMLVHHPMRVRHGEFCMVMLDVGQGLSIWIKTSKHAVLFDVGPRYAGYKVVLPFLSAQGLKQLSHIIISHWDLDHVGGLEAIETKTKAKLITSDAKLGEPCLYGKSFELDGVSFNFYHPTKKRHKSKNKNSCVLLVSNQNHSAILLGDIDQQDENNLVSRLWGQSVDLMVAAHHGSKGSNGYPLLYTLHPKIIWVSAGRHNPYHHPHKESMNRFYSVTNQVKVTAIDGQQYFNG